MVRVRAASPIVLLACPPSPFLPPSAFSYSSFGPSSSPRFGRGESFAMLVPPDPAQRRDAVMLCSCPFTGIPAAGGIRPVLQRSSAFIGTMGNFNVGLLSEFQRFLHGTQPNCKVAQEIGSLGRRNSLKNNDIKSGRSLQHGFSWPFLGVVLSFLPCPPPAATDRGENGAGWSFPPTRRERRAWYRLRRPRAVNGPRLI